MEQWANWAWLLGIIGFIIAFLMYSALKKKDPGDETMQDLAQQIHEGAMVFLRREYSILVVFIIVVFLLLFFGLEWQTAVAYLGGYLEHRRKTPIGIQVLWRGWSKLHDLCEGWQLAQDT